MKKILLAITLLLLGSPALAQKTPAQIQTEITQTFRPGCIGCITAGAVSSVLIDIATSYVSITLAQPNTVKCNPTGAAANVQDCTTLPSGLIIPSPTFNGPAASRPLFDFHNLFDPSSMDLRFFGTLSNATQNIGAIINPGYAVGTFGSQVGDIDFLICGAAPGIADADCNALGGQVRQGGMALQGNVVGLGVAFFPFTDGEIALGRSGSRWSDLQVQKGTVGGNLTINGGAVPTPTSGSGTVFANTTNGINLFGLGSVNDVTLVNFTGTVAAGVPSGTTNFNVVGQYLVNGSQISASNLSNGVVGTGKIVLSNSVGLMSSTITGVNFNSANTDNSITIPLPTGYTRYMVNSVRISNPSAALSTASAGVFTAAGGGGQSIATNATLTITAATDNTNNNAQSIVLNNINTESYNAGTVFFRVGTAQGSAATGNVSIFYFPLP